eukprot:jgi/Tetstr1/434529/TSEL_023620.t1
MLFDNSTEEQNFNLRLQVSKLQIEVQRLRTRVRLLEAENNRLYDALAQEQSNRKAARVGPPCGGDDSPFSGMRIRWPGDPAVTLPAGGRDETGGQHSAGKAPSVDGELELARRELTGALVEAEAATKLRTSRPEADAPVPSTSQHVAAGVGYVPSGSPGELPAAAISVGTSPKAPSANSPAAPALSPGDRKRVSHVATSPGRSAGGDPEKKRVSNMSTSPLRESPGAVDRSAGTQFGATVDPGRLQVTAVAAARSIAGAPSHAPRASSVLDRLQAVRAVHRRVEPSQPQAELRRRRQRPEEEYVEVMHELNVGMAHAPSKYRRATAAADRATATEELLQVTEVLRQLSPSPHARQASGEEFRSLHVNPRQRHSSSRSPVADYRRQRPQSRSPAGFRIAARQKFQPQGAPHPHSQLARNDKRVGGRAAQGRRQASPSPVVEQEGPSPHHLESWMASNGVDEELAATEDTREQQDATVSAIHVPQMSAVDSGRTGMQDTAAPSLPPDPVAPSPVVDVIVDSGRQQHTARSPTGWLGGDAGASPAAMEELDFLFEEIRSLEGQLSEVQAQLGSPSAEEPTPVRRHRRGLKQEYSKRQQNLEELKKAAAMAEPYKPRWQRPPGRSVSPPLRLLGTGSSPDVPAVHAHRGAAGRSKSAGLPNQRQRRLTECHIMEDLHFPPAYVRGVQVQDIPDTKKPLAPRHHKPRKSNRNPQEKAANRLSRGLSAKQQYGAASHKGRDLRGGVRDGLRKAAAARMRC